jgi:hypothetical protein
VRSNGDFALWQAIGRLLRLKAEEVHSESIVD